MYWRKLQKKLTNYNIKEELEEIMRSISSAIISLTCWYILTNYNDERDGERVFLALMSFVMLVVSIILMILGF